MYLQIYFHKIDMYVKNLTQVSLDIMSRSSEVILYISNNIPPGFRVVSLCAIGFVLAIFLPLSLKYHSNERQWQYPRNTIFRISSSSNSDQNKSIFVFKSINDRKYLDQQYFIKTKIQKQRFPWNLWMLERNLDLNIVICKCHLIVSNLISILNPESAEEVFKKVVTIYNEMRLSNTPLYHFIFDNFPIKV